MNDNISISPATPADLPEILSVQKEVFRQEADRIGDHGIAPLHEELGSITGQLESHKILKAACCGRIVGTVRARMEGGQCLIGRLAVHPQFQRRGIARRLLREAEGCFPDASAYVIFTEPGNARALELYNGAGYTPTGKTLRDPLSGTGLIELARVNQKQ